MKPARLYIDNFMCHDKSFIDFTQFSAAIIMGNKEQNDLYANGVGKTTIFKAIEYVLFNQSDVNLERIIRDDTDSCCVVLDFTIDEQEYRLFRKRTRKGSSDLGLLIRNNVAGEDTEIYHQAAGNICTPLLDKETVKKYWKDLSGSRSGDTEKDVAKLLKFNPKSFRNTKHFVQNDFSGLSTATPEKRKAILKEGFNLLVYSKLEKLAKDKSTFLSKEIDRNNTLLTTLGDPESDLVKIKDQLIQVESTLKDKKSLLVQFTIDSEQFNLKINDLTNLHKNLESKYTNLLLQQTTLNNEKTKLETSVKEYQSKKNNAAKAAKDLVTEIDRLKETQTKLIEIDYNQVDILNNSSATFKEEIAHLNVVIKNSIEKYEDFKIPLPQGNVCKSCRKPMTDQERQEHQLHINQEMVNCQKLIQESKSKIVECNSQISKNQQAINSLNLSKQQLETINIQISSKNKEIADKRGLYQEYDGLLKKFSAELSNKTNELQLVVEGLSKSSMVEDKNIQAQIDEEKAKLDSLVTQSNAINKEVTHYSNNKAVLEHTLEQKNKDLASCNEIKLKLKDLNEKFSIYPLVIQGFSSTGIPNLIIQNILDDLQIETNNLLSQLKPGGKEIQLSFFVEKKVEKTGDQADTLDINYHVNGKNRYYEQLSGAQQIAVMFSLKIGLAFLLQKMMGADIKLLLLDEIDQSLDKASVDEYANIIKFFQKDFIVLLITHNDRLKDKFSHSILVEQDINMVSTARVVSSWN